MKKVLIIVIIIAVLAITFFVFQSSDDSSPAKNYVGNSAEECSRIQVMCTEGFQRFDDENGCGCEEI